MSQDEAQRLLFWSGRKAAFPAVGRISPDYYCIDGTIPRAALPRVLRQIETWSQRVRLAVRERLPRRRRQPASADPVRRQQAGRHASARSNSATHPGAVHRGRRHDHRRARRRRREDRRHVRAVPPPGSSGSSASSARSTPTRCSIPARRCRRSHRCAEFGPHARASWRAAASGAAAFLKERR